MNWTIAQKKDSQGTIVVVRRVRTNKLMQKLLGPEQEEEVGRVRRDREQSANRDRSFNKQLEIVVERATQVAAVKNNWHK